MNGAYATSTYESSNLKMEHIAAAFSLIISLFIFNFNLQDEQV